jgi:hypothetical protein
VRVGMPLDHEKEVAGTSGLDAQPEVILKMPEDSILPLLCALALTLAFAGLLVHLWWLAGASAIAGLALTLAWMWPRGNIGQLAEQRP